MNYYNILNFKKEPFSNSPEPEFLLQLPQYSDCLQKLELAVRLRRGINVVIGDIGTGKTTLCRKLIQNFSSPSADSAETEIETHLLLDPAFNNAAEFLQTVCIMLGIENSDNNAISEWHLKEKIKDYLFNKGVDEKRIVVLIIDEGQKIPENCLEILREILNYETNKFKLLQIIIFAQKEFKAVLEKKANLLDRVNLLYHLQPLNFRQMKEMIDYRLSVARDFEKSPSLFSWGGFAAIYLATGGYPRKVVLLCHQVVLKMIIRGRNIAGWFLVRSCRSEMKSTLKRKLGWVLAGLLLMVILGISVIGITLQGINVAANKKLKFVSSDPVVLKVKNDEVPEVTMPDYIGKISMTKRRTIWWTLSNIYGDTGPQIMGEILKVNPFVKNNDKIMVGATITLPSIPADNEPIKQGDIVVALKSGQDLEKMYNIFRNNPEETKLPQLAFLSFWNKKKGFEFAVIIDKKFKDIKSAEETIDKLPQEIAVKTKIISQWDADTVFFNRRTLQY